MSVLYGKCERLEKQMPHNTLTDHIAIPIPVYMQRMRQQSGAMAGFLAPKRVPDSAVCRSLVTLQNGVRGGKATESFRRNQPLGSDATMNPSTLSMHLVSRLRMIDVIRPMVNKIKQ